MHERSRGTANFLLVVGTALGIAVSAVPARTQGKAISDVYLDKCAVCHGADGAGKTARGRKLKVRDVRETAAKQTPEQMAEVVLKGKAPNMDGYAKELSAEEVRQIVEYYRGLAKK
jgi:mono/diheme cytochrome c family protein